MWALIRPETVLPLKGSLSQAMINLCILPLLCKHVKWKARWKCDIQLMLRICPNYRSEKSTIVLSVVSHCASCLFPPSLYSRQYLSHSASSHLSESTQASWERERINFLTSVTRQRNHLTGFLFWSEQRVGCKQIWCRNAKWVFTHTVIILELIKFFWLLFMRFYFFIYSIYLRSHIIITFIQFLHVHFFLFLNYFLRKTDNKHQCRITFEELTASPHWPDNCLVDPKVQTDWFLENRFQFFWCPVFCACKFPCPLLVWPLGQDWMGFLCPLQPYEHTSVGAYFSWLFFLSISLFILNSTHCPPLLYSFSVSFIPAVVQLASLRSVLAAPALCTAVELLLWEAAEEIGSRTNAVVLSQ